MHDDGVALTDERQHFLQLRPVEVLTGHAVFVDFLHADRFELGALPFGVLVSGADSDIADFHVSLTGRETKVHFMAQNHLNETMKGVVVAVSRGCTRIAGSDYPMDTKFMTVSDLRFRNTTNFEFVAVRGLDAAYRPT